MGSFSQDLRGGLRSLGRSPAITLFSVLLLALGIGAGTAVYVLLDTVFLHPLVVREPDRLAAIFRTVRTASGEYTGFNPVSYPDFLDLARRSERFSELSAYQTTAVSFAAGGEAERVQGMFASANYFDLLGLKPLRGRFFLPGEDVSETASPVAVLSHAAWGRLFGADPGILGRRISLNGKSFEIVGIAPKGFTGTDFSRAADLWIPLASFRELSPYGEFFEDRGFAPFLCMGKLRRGVDAGVAEEELKAIAAQLAVEFPETDGDKGLTQLPLVTAALPARDRGRYVNFGRTITVSFGLVLFVACFNIGNLLLVRGFDRLGDSAVRQAFGASRLQALRPHLLESSLLFVLGGILSLPVARWGLGVLWSLRPPELAEASPDLRLGASAVGFAWLLTAVTGLCFSILPAIQTLRPEHNSLFQISRPVGDRRHWTRLGVPVSIQVGLTFIAMVGAGLFARSLAAARDVDLGFDAERMAVLTVAPGDQGYAEERGRLYYESLLERIRALPGVESATLSENRLLRGAILRNEIFREGEDIPVTNGEQTAHRINVVVPGFFKTVRIPLLAGRDFGETDCATCPGVIIVNQALAEALWPGDEAVGRRIHLGNQEDPPFEIVGVARNAKYRNIFEPQEFFIYRPLSQSYVSAMTLHVRTAVRDPEELLPAIQSEARKIDPQLPFADVGTMDQFIAKALWFERISSLLLLALSLLALILALLGIYTAATYSVGRRTRELGIRLALGASRWKLQRMILLETALVMGAGVALGWALALFGLSRMIAGQLHGVDAGSPPIYAVQALLLLAAGLSGAYLSSRKILKIEPAGVLRMS